LGQIIKGVMKQKIALPGSMIQVMAFRLQQVFMFAEAKRKKNWQSRVHATNSPNVMGLW
jgi:hypothetical protein